MSKKYVTEIVLATTFDISVQRLRNDRFNRKGFPYVKIGKSVRYDLEEIMAIVEESKIVTSSSLGNEEVA
jgi:hypothetical protein